MQAAYQSDTAGIVNPRCLQKAYTKLDARVGVEGSEGRWYLLMRGKNLTDKHTFSGCPATPLRPGYFTYNTELPRTIAMEEGFRF